MSNLIEMNITTTQMFLVECLTLCNYDLIFRSKCYIIFGTLDPLK